MTASKVQGSRKLIFSIVGDMLSLILFVRKKNITEDFPDEFVPPHRPVKGILANCNVAIPQSCFCHTTKHGLATDEATLKLSFLPAGAVAYRAKAASFLLA